MSAPTTTIEVGARHDEADHVDITPQAVRGSRRSPLSADTRCALAVFLLVFGVCALTMGGHTYSVDEETYFAGTRALLNGETVITSTPDVDAVVILVNHKNGGMTTAAPVGTLLLFAPFYVLGRLLALPSSGIVAEEVIRLVFLTANSVFTALTAAMLVPLARMLGARLRSAVLLALAYGLGTWAWAHSQTAFSEPGSAMLLTATMLASVRWWRRPSPRAAALVGLLAGCAALTRATLLLFIPIIWLAGLAGRSDTSGARKGREALAFAGGGIAPGIAFAANAYLRFGSPFDSGYPPMAFTTPIYEGIFGLFLSAGKGIFWYAPITLVVLFALRQSFIRQRRYVVAVGLMLATHLAVFGRFEIWSGENAYGPRYMVPLLPLLVSLLAPVIDSARQWSRAAKVAAVVGFVGPGLLGSTMYFNAVYFHTYPEIARNLEMEQFDTRQLFLAWHFQPRSSPLVLHAHSLDELFSNTADRIRGGTGGITAMPENYEDRIHWYARSVELDTWWAWWRTKNGPTGAFGLLAIPFGCLAASAALFRRLRREAGGLPDARGRST